MARTIALLVAIFQSASACTRPQTSELGCKYSAPSCPSGQTLESYGSCGWWGIGKYRKCNGSTCCSGYGGASCGPICTGGCGQGTCTSPGTCTCRAGFTGAKCDTRLTPLPKLTVLSINFACRDVAQLSGCDNCQTRFDLIAKAISGDEPQSFAGVANFSNVDVVIAQELGTDEENFVQVTQALASHGLVHTTGAAAPTSSDPQCADAPGPLFDLTTKQAFARLSGLKSGGLVTFSRHPILRTAKQNWCAHNLPAPAGYLSTLLDVRGVASLVVNTHLMPEYDFGITAHDVRTYQFSELAGFANKAEHALRQSGSPFAIVIGGDFNEDAYGLQSTTASVDCGRIDQGGTGKRLAALNLDLRAACEAGAIGEPTWSPTANDLAQRFSSGSAKHEVLDYIVLHSSSTPEGVGKTPAINTVATLRKASNKEWHGTFCESALLGTMGETSSGTASALTDHNTVTSTITLPDVPKDAAASASAATTAFQTILPTWRSSSGAQEAACGQTSALCGVDTNCCEAEFSWTGIEQHCDYDFKCKACVPLGGSCGSAILQIEGSPCCGYDDYTSSNGAHCELTTSGPICVRKFNKGATCAWDEECQSKNCKTQYWWWIPIGKKCD